jgi:hypothetical protein
LSVEEMNVSIRDQKAKSRQRKTRILFRVESELFLLYSRNMKNPRKA